MKHIVSKNSIRIRNIVIMLLIGISVGTIVFDKLKYLKLKDQLIINEAIYQNGLNDLESKIQINQAAISFQNERQRKLIFLRDQILKENRKVKLNEAYEYAENIITLSERFQSFDEFFMYALQKNESNFDASAISSKGAIGIAQIWPSTGRMLCNMIGWEYSEKVLKDPKKNAHLAAVYLDLLNVVYNGNKELMLAEYNGGPDQAALLSKNKEIYPETKKYIKDVMFTYNHYKRLYDES